MTVLMPLEILHGALVLLGAGPRRKSAEIAPPAGPRILLTRIETGFAGGKFADHRRMSRNLNAYQIK
jgi:hypothetical protein